MASRNPATILVALAALCGACQPPDYHVEAFGTGIRGHKDGKVEHARFNGPAGMAACADSYLQGILPCFSDGMNVGLYVADRDSHRIRGVYLGDGAGGGSDYAYSGKRVITIAGNGRAGQADGLASTARFKHPEDVALPYWGGNGPQPALLDLVVADTGNHQLRGVSKGHVTTLAGTGKAGFVDGPAGKAMFNQPAGVAIDATGRIYVADRANHRVRIYFEFKVSTLAGSGQKGFADGAAAKARFNEPTAVTVDEDGVVYVADRGNGTVRRVRNGQVDSLVPTGAGITAPAAVGGYPDEIYVADRGGSLRTIFSGALGTHAEGEGYTAPAGLAFFRRKTSADEIIFLSDAGTHKIWLIETW